MAVKVPFPVILNEVAFAPCASRRDFIGRLEELDELVLAFRAYGYGMRFAYSRTLLKKTCWAQVDFGKWLYGQKPVDPRERTLRQKLLAMIANGTSFEDLGLQYGYDFLWNGRLIYGGGTGCPVPAFLVSYDWGLPSAALAIGVFRGTVNFRLQKEELTADGQLVREIVGLLAFSEKRQLLDHSKGLEERVVQAVQSGVALLDVCKCLLPRISFSEDVCSSLPRISFSDFPVVRELMRLHAVFEKCLEQGTTDFYSAYGRLKSLAMRESDTRMAEWPHCRDFKWADGTIRKCEPHVKVGNHNRIHFSPGFDSGVLYVGYIGPHLNP